ncbi:MAG: class I SAM-dependent methyltransferase [Syntrophobacterales bacterium]|jgi:2-polyprenyl-3-methyl-5-hydroxy-6-metoxy-1,4-benzoquinol methylase|nr:class I SAM-dependent methyltransferase [Syntrophobacterales bacterium]
MNEDKKVKDYFTRAAKDFDDIYDNKGGLITRIANVVFRRGMRERFDLALDLCGTGDRTVFDIGCGAGRFTIPLAERGMKVTGIDYSPEMIRMANNYVKMKKQDGKLLRIIHICGDFMSGFNKKEKFDVTLAMGVVDYIRDPVPFLKKMKNITAGRMIVSFPSKFTPQMPIRRIWLTTKDCPVFFYTRSRIVELCAVARINEYEIIPIKAGYLVKAEV